MPISKVWEFLRRKWPRRKRVTEYQKMASTFTQRLQLWRQMNFPAPSDARVGILLTPWLGSAVPFYNLEFALELARNGCRVTIFRDFSNLFDNAPHSAVIQTLDEVLAAMPEVVKIEDVARWPSNPKPSDRALMEKIISENAIWKMRGEERAREFVESRPEQLAQTCEHLGRLHSLLSECPQDWLFIPGGIWALSAMYLAAANQHGVGVSTYDSDPNILLLAHGGPATHHADLPQSFARLKGESREDPEREDRLVQAGHEELARRVAGKDDFGFQMVAAGQAERDGGTVLIPLNLRWDSASLSRGRLFPTVAEWLQAVVHWAEKRPEVRLCIRQHPLERFPLSRGKDDVTSIWQDSPARDRITYVAAADPISTYDLLRSARVVLPYTSTVGIEATMLGLPVIMATHCYYAELGFIWNAGSVGEYFEYLDQALEGQLKISAGAARDAAIAYVIGQRWGQVRTFLTPIPSDFYKWAALTPQDLWRLPDAEDVREALLTRVPLSYLGYRRAFGGANRSPQKDAPVA